MIGKNRQASQIEINHVTWSTDRGLKNFVLLSDTGVILWNTLLCGEERTKRANVEASSAAT
jgi:hypothetical protein